ncbi:hypothetical protein ABK040_013626 [Willaertia magna]
MSSEAEREALNILEDEEEVLVNNNNTNTKKRDTKEEEVNNNKKDDNLLDDKKLKRRKIMNELNIDTNVVSDKENEGHNEEQDKTTLVELPTTPASPKNLPKDDDYESKLDEYVKKEEYDKLIRSQNEIITKLKNDFNIIVAKYKQEIKNLQEEVEQLKKK